MDINCFVVFLIIKLICIIYIMREKEGSRMILSLFLVLYFDVEQFRQSYKNKFDILSIEVVY